MRRVINKDKGKRIKVKGGKKLGGQKDRR